MFTIGIYSLAKGLFKSFACFLIGMFSYYKILELLIYFAHKSFVQNIFGSFIML